MAKHKVVKQAEVVNDDVDSAPRESETDFLKRLLAFQNNGKFGTHLNQIILDRIKEIEGLEVLHFENGKLISPETTE